MAATRCKVMKYDFGYLWMVAAIGGGHCKKVG